MAFGGRLEAFFTVPSGTTVSATSFAGGTDAVSLTAGSYTPTLYLAHLVSRLNAVNTNAWSGSISTGASGTGKITLSCSSTPYALTFTTPEAGTIMGLDGDISSTSSATVMTYNARGLWLPKCPLQLDGHPTRAPKVTDARGSVGPSGESITYVGTRRYRHRNLRWSHVAPSRMFVGSDTVGYASLQQWFDDTQYGAGHSWFRPGSAFQIYWSNNGTEAIVGADLNAGSGPTYGWTIQPALASFEPRRVGEQGFLGWWEMVFPEVVSRG